MQNPAQQYEQELRKRLEDTLYPPESVCSTFGKLLKLALRHQNCKSIECDWGTYKRLLKTSPYGFNLYDMSFAINAVTYCTPDQLGLDMHEYVSVGDAMESMAKVWNELVEPIKTNLNRKVSALTGIRKPIGRA